jgi:cobalt-zinc-cadmium efflux system outer membrane protein
MRLSAFLLCIAFCTLPISAQDLTEREVLQKLSSESPRARALSLQVELARATALTEGLRPNGSLSLSREAAAGVPETYLLYEQPLSVTGRRDYLRRAAMAAAESEGMGVRIQLHELRVDARLAFLDLLLAQEQLNTISAEIGLLKETVEVIRKREKAGESSGYDRVRAEREMSLLEGEQGGALARMERARGQLASFFGPSQPAGALRAVGTLALPALPDLASLLSRTATRGDIQAERQLAESAALSREAARRKIYPEPVVAGGLKTPVIENNREAGYVLSVTVPLPLFDRGKADMTRAEIAQRAAQARAEAITIEVQLRLKGTWEETQVRIRAAQTYQNRAVTETLDLVRIARTAYEGGEVGILELLDAYRTQREVRLRMQELIAAARQSALELERLTGEEVIQ